MSLWSKITGLSDDELEKETWHQGDSVKKNMSVDKYEYVGGKAGKVEKNEDFEELMDEAELFAPKFEESEEENSLNIEENWEPEEEGQLAIDVFQDDDKVVIKSAIAGVKQKDLDITISNDTVSIHGEREHSEKIKDNDYFYQECYWGKFSRSVVLPFEIDESKSKANLEDGILTIVLPIKKEDKQTKVEVKEKKKKKK